MAAPSESSMDKAATFARLIELKHEQMARSGSRGCDWKRIMNWVSPCLMHNYHTLLT